MQTSVHRGARRRPTRTRHRPRILESSSTSAFIGSAKHLVAPDGCPARTTGNTRRPASQTCARRGRNRSQRIGVLVDGFETVIYAIAFVLLVAAAVLVVIGGAEAVVQGATHKVNTLQGGVAILDRVLMVLIIAEIAATLRAVLLYHEIAAEPFLFIGLIAYVRRILIVTAASEQVHSDKELNRPTARTRRAWAACHRHRVGDLHDPLQRSTRSADAMPKTAELTAATGLPAPRRRVYACGACVRA